MSTPLYPPFTDGCDDPLEPPGGRDLLDQTGGRTLREYVNGRGRYGVLLLVALGSLAIMGAQKFFRWLILRSDRLVDALSPWPDERLSGPVE